MESAKVPPGVRKAKKKQVKDELDRLKQAEKKKRRLEKALATSAAIRSELEKKKQKKKEEQQRLDEEGAAIAEAVALYVLLGEDSDDSCKIMLKEDEGFRPWDFASNIDLYMGGRRFVLPHQDLPKHALEGIGWISNVYGSGCKWNEWESGPFMGDLYMPYSDERGWETTEISAGHIAAQAVASLQIAEDACVDPYVFNRMLRG
ncbi:Threonine--tRNA ligase [Actinidia chinensis var. chinensis]|uniref:Threonine--tRNA ligase n=1 Tax=Actinidia chinensis var. chinensis TaxID=1590841 RepID=A0A2R6Q924_ACTCC|nr:Threonine--tRNA ligase [Actinidia chinensis var. chinensis]